MMKLLILALAIIEVSAFAGLAVSKLHGSKVVVMHGGKGFGGGEATRDPAPTYIDPNDPKGKQQAIHKACLLYTSPSPRDQRGSRMPSSA